MRATITLALGLLLALPPAADAGTMGPGGFEAALGETNEVRVRTVAGPLPFELTDLGAPVSAGPGCQQVDPSTVRCPSAGGLLGTGSWFVKLGDGDDRLETFDSDGEFYGGAGNDVLVANGLGASVPAPYLYGEDGDDRIEAATADPILAEGGIGDDRLRGGPSNDDLHGGPGDDRIDGGGGNDRIVAGPGTIQAGPVAVDYESWRHLHSDDDKVRGGDGDDDILGGPGADLLAGGDGDDLIGFDCHFFCTAATDERGDDRIDGGAGDDRLGGGQGDDVIDGGTGANVFDGGEGIDTATFADRTADMTIDLSAQPGPFPSPPADEFALVENVIGGSGADVIFGDGNANRLDGGPGGAADELHGGGGDDQLLGRDGADVLAGGDGADDLRAGPGADSVDAGPGEDRVDTRDGAVDTVDCGYGLDRWFADRADPPGSGCELSVLPPLPRAP